MPDDLALATVETELTSYVLKGATKVGPETGEFISACAKEAVALVDRAIGTVEIPAEIVMRAYLECGSELFQRRAAPQGTSQFATPDGVPVTARVSRDPMSGARIVLDPFMPLGFA